MGAGMNKKRRRVRQMLGCRFPSDPLAKPRRPPLGFYMKNAG
jgi:hypothetical protein